MVSVYTTRTIKDVQVALTIIDAMRKGTATNVQRNLYMAGLVGCWGRSDVNRIQIAVNQIATLLRAKGKDITVSPVTITPNRAMTLEHLNQIMANIKLLRDAYYVKSSTPDIPSLTGEMTIEKANAIEQNLLDISLLLDGEIASYRYSGTQFNSGVDAL